MENKLSFKNTNLKNELDELYENFKLIFKENYDNKDIFSGNLESYTYMNTLSLNLKYLELKGENEELLKILNELFEDSQYDQGIFKFKNSVKKRKIRKSKKNKNAKKTY